jgi:hypothetical protein
VTLTGKSIVIRPAKAKIQLTNFPKLLTFIIADTITWRKHNNTNIINKQKPIAPLSDNISR